MKGPISGKKLSLEKLPFEILGQIFIFSGNLNFFEVSRTLRASVDTTFFRSDGFREDLVIQVCTHERPCAESSPYDLPESQVEASTDDSAGNETVLFEQLWFTWDLYARCRRKAELAALRRELVAASTEDPRWRRTQALAEMEAAHAYFDDERCEGEHWSNYITYEPDEPRNFAYTCDSLSQRLEAAIHHEDHDTLAYHGDAAFRHEDNRLWIRRSGRPGVPDVSIALDFPRQSIALEGGRVVDTGRRPELPRRLLRGPWTQDKGSLLELLCHRGAVVRERDRDASRRGLRNAIREGCTAAMAFLLVDFWASNALRLARSVWHSVGWDDGVEERQSINGLETWTRLQYGLSLVHHGRPLAAPTVDDFALLAECAGRFDGWENVLFTLMAYAAVVSGPANRRDFLVDEALGALRDNLAGVATVGAVKQLFGRAEN